MPDHAKRINAEKVTPLVRPPHEPGTVIITTADIEQEALISADIYTDYPLMFCLHGRRAETIWLHPAPGQDEVGCISWFDIYRVKPGKKRQTKAAPETITLYLRNGDRCFIEGRHLEELMARLAARHVLQVWAFDGERWPKVEEGRGVITGISYEEAATGS